MLAEQRRRPAVDAWGFGELDWSRGERQGAAQPRVGDLLEQMSGADVRVVERLLRGVDLARHDIGFFECGQCLGAAPRGSASQCSSPIIRHQRRNIAGPIAVATIQPSEQRKMSAGPELKPRLSAALRSNPVKACSIRLALAKAIAVRSNAPSTFCPRPDLPRSSSAAKVPNADRHAVPKSTQGNLIAVGCSGVPDR